MNLETWLESKGISKSEAPGFMEYTADLCNFLSGRPHGSSRERLLEDFPAWYNIARKLEGFPSQSLYVEVCLAGEPFEGRTAVRRSFQNTSLDVALNQLFTLEDWQNFLRSYPIPAQPLSHTRNVASHEVKDMLMDIVRDEQEELRRLGRKMVDVHTGIVTAPGWIAYQREHGRVSGYANTVRELAAALLWEASGKAGREQLERYVRTASGWAEFDPSMGSGFYQNQLVAALKQGGVPEETATEFADRMAKKGREISQTNEPDSLVR